MQDDHWKMRPDKGKALMLAKRQLAFARLMLDV